MVDRSLNSCKQIGCKMHLKFCVSTPKLLLAKCYGLSLSDQYWVKPINSDLEWEVVNFFDNDFSEDVGDILFGKAKDSENISLNSPDNTSDGCLKKRWKIINQKRCLLKAGSLPYEQQPFNEAIASLIMDKLNVDHVNYSVMVDDEKPYSVCEDFISRDTELVTAWKILQNSQSLITCLFISIILTVAILWALMTSLIKSIK